jgi:hypothetical protein
LLDLADGETAAARSRSTIPFTISLLELRSLLLESDGELWESLSNLADWLVVDGLEWQPFGPVLGPADHVRRSRPAHPSDSSFALARTIGVSAGVWECPYRLVVGDHHKALLMHISVRTCGAKSQVIGVRVEQT